MNFLLQFNIKLKYVLVFTLILFSGNPYILRSSFFKPILVIVFCFLVLLYLNILKYHFTQAKKILFYIVFFLLIFLAQFFIFEWISFNTVLGFSIRVFTGVLIVTIVGRDFITLYTNILVVISTYSIFFFFIHNLGVFIIPNILPINGVDTINSIGFFFISNMESTRNMGMFWEPGAFAGYIILAFVLNIKKIKYLMRRETFKFSMLMVAILTTISTAGYLLFFLILIYVYSKDIKKNFILGIPIITVIIYFSYSYFKSADFLYEKIQSQYEVSQELEGEYDPSRFGSLLFDLHYIKKHPLFGNGLHDRTRFADHPWLQTEDRAGAGNGFSNFIASMGFLSLFFYIYLLFKRLDYEKYEKIFVIFIFILMLQTEQYLNFPLFLGLPFLIVDS